MPRDRAARAVLSGLAGGKEFLCDRRHMRYVCSRKFAAMPKTLEAITHDVLELPRTQRLALARIIFDLDEGPADPDAEAAWDAEIRARLKAFDEGKIEAVPYESFREDMEKRFGR